MAIFDFDIGRHIEMANNVQQQDTMVTIQFVNINCEKLKSSVTDQCSVWQQMFSQLLLRIAEENVARIYKYVTESSKK